jgi:WD40 repeat protein
VSIWQPYSSTSAQIFKAHSDPVSIVLVSPDGRFVVTGSTTDELTLWSIPEFARIASFQCDGRIKDVALATGAALIVVADAAAGVHFLHPMNIAEI